MADDDSSRPKRRARRAVVAPALPPAAPAPRVALYVPGDVAAWNGKPPRSLTEALDRIAARLGPIE